MLEYSKANIICFRNKQRTVSVTLHTKGDITYLKYYINQHQYSQCYLVYGTQEVKRM
jgi:hypothetical protein